ncbi:MAG: hypothetical protein VX000_17575, partial [Myxococcota bacterium]|nr:hypothetical protein [Myxococcota bacterium]
ANILNAPAHELDRSPAASRIGSLAAASGLFLAHFEQRWEPDWPQTWNPRGRPDLGERATWTHGTLPETKFRTFQHDRLIGSLHPAHRAKWTAHELCHGLVGFGWRPDASPLWRATAARIAELLPVALWYFFDEAGLRRCDDHTGGGPLFGSHCLACEQAAAEGPVPCDPGPWYEAGRAFIAQELAAVSRTRRLGRPVPHRYATLELCSDGLAYEAAHGARMSSRQFHRWVERFCEAGDGWHVTLDALEARVLELVDHLCGDATALPWRGGRERWIAQDLGWRLLCLEADAEGELSEELSRLADALAASPDQGGIASCIDRYRLLHADWVLPAPGEVFGVGYPLPGGLGIAEDQLAAGIRSALPATWALMGDEASDIVSEFAHMNTRTERAPIGQRFARFLASANEPRQWVDQATFEAAVTHAVPGEAGQATLGSVRAAGDMVTTATGVTLVRVEHGVTTEPAAVDAAIGPLDEPMDLAIRRAPDGEVDVVQLSTAAANALAMATAPSMMADLGLDADERDGLLRLGLLVPAAWEL